MGLTSWRNVNSTSSLGEMFFGLCTIETRDGNRLDGGGVDQVPIVEQLSNWYTISPVLCISSSHNFLTALKS